MYWVYIATNVANKTLYIGVTNNIQRRIYEHKSKTMKGFTERYKINKLIYFEEYKEIQDAIAREKQLKNWKRQWKIELIKSVNPTLKEISIE